LSKSVGKVDEFTNLNRATILIVDDEKFNCDIIYGFLMILGVPNRKEICEFAYNGQQALELI
jgi:CheY-like chemotaxis protein